MEQGRLFDDPKRPEFHRPDSWGERPNIKRDDVLGAASDIYSRGNSELANELVDAYDEGENWVIEQIHKYINMMGQ